MDALKLLILASEDHRKSNKSNDFSSPQPFEDETGIDEICCGDRRDSIMLLAEQASKITPIKNFHRPRASSEPWMTNSSIQTLFPHSKMQYQPNMPNLNMGMPMFVDASAPKSVVPLSSSMPSSSSSSGSNVRSSGGAMTASNTVPFTTNLDVVIQPQKQQIFDSSGAENVNGDGLFLCQMKENLDPGTSSLSEGRIGIYNKEERKALIRKFHEKQKRRIWNKKVRYFCRKNLADTRVRIKGRFVNPEKYNKILAEQALASGKSPAFVYANIGKAVDDISPTTSNEEGAIDRAHSTANGSSTTITNHAMDSSSSSSSSSSTNLSTFPHNHSVVFPHGNGNSITMGGSSSGMFNGWPDGISYVPMGSSGPISGLTQRLFHGSMDSSTSVPGGFYIPYGLVHGSMMSASTDSATSAYSSGSSSAAALAAALAAGASSSGYPSGFYHFGSSSDSLQAPSGSTDSSGSASSSSSSLGLLNMFALMTSQSMDSLDVNGTDPFANLKLSLSSQSQDIINGSSTGSGIDGTSDFNHHDSSSSSSSNSNSNSNTVPADVSSSITSGIVADPSTVNSSSGVLAVNPTDKVDGNTITTVEIKSNNRKTRKRKSTTSPPTEIEAEGEGEGESPSSSSTSSPHDDVSSTGKKSVSKQRSRSKSQQQQQQQQESVISQSTEQVEVDHHKQQQTSLRKKK